MIWLETSRFITQTILLKNSDMAKPSARSPCSDVRGEAEEGRDGASMTATRKRRLWGLTLGLGLNAFVRALHARCARRCQPSWRFASRGCPRQSLRRHCQPLPPPAPPAAHATICHLREPCASCHAQLLGWLSDGSPTLGTGESARTCGIL